MTPSQKSLEAEARRWFTEHTGKSWRSADTTERRKWMESCEPTLRAEYGIAADAVWQDGNWQPAGQSALFDIPSPRTGEPNGGAR